MEIKYDVVHRDVKYPRLEFKTGSLILVMPEDNTDYSKIIEKHKNWIYAKRSIIKNALIEAEGKKYVDRSDDEFRELVYSCVENICKELKLGVNKIFFRKMKSKWGSLSSKRNLTINILLKYLPDELVEYVIFHELTHLIERRHNEHFWRIIAKNFKDYQEKEKDLLVYWFLIQQDVIEKSIEMA
ncbi:hypothetical protein BMS3Bbin15_00299 [archaeon BMS3Bbin15]|nr:hypothetical protein BMS3Bbin15_00299 [archaeon BMS3Bbin15]